MSRKLLIVDDNQGCADLYQMRFEYDKWAVKICFSAEEALDLFKTGYMPDAILLDVMLPKMQGDELLKILRDNPKTKDIKIVILTALNLNPDDEKRICDHADACLSKIDILPAKLVQTVNNLVEEKAPSR